MFIIEAIIMAKDQVVAIDIGNSNVKILYIKKTTEGLRLAGVGVSSITNPDNMEQTAATIKELWNRFGIKQNIFNKHRMEVAIALPRGSVVTKRLLNLPASTTDAQLPSIIEMAAETELPFQVDESVFTYHDVQRTTESVSVELVSTRRDTVTRYTETISATGNTPSAIVPSMLAIETVSRDALTNPEARTIIVDVGAGHTDFCLMKGNTLQFSRGFSVSGNHLTRTLMSELQVDVETAEQEKQNIPANQLPTRTWTRNFIGEIERSIAAAQREMNDEEFGEIDEVWLCGGGARVPELTETCQEQLQIPTRLWHPLQTGVLDTSSVDASILENYGDTLAIPLGIGIHVLGTEKPVSLLPTEVGVKRAESSRKHQQLIAAGIAGFVILVLAFAGITFSRSQKSKEDYLDQRIATYTMLQNDANKQLARELILVDKLSHQISPMDVLHALSTLFNDRTKVAWKTFEISNLDDLQKARISFSLQANSHDAINSMPEILNQTNMFDKIETGEVTTTGDERRPTFEVKITCQLTNEAIQLFAQKRHPKPVIEFNEVITEDFNVENTEDIDISPPSDGIESPDEPTDEEEEAEKE